MACEAKRCVTRNRVPEWMAAPDTAWVRTGSGSGVTLAGRNPIPNKINPKRIRMRHTCAKLTSSRCTDFRFAHRSVNAVDNDVQWRVVCDAHMHFRIKRFHHKL